VLLEPGGHEVMSHGGVKLAPCTLVGDVPSLELN
jgi:hypothetical protein